MAVAIETTIKTASQTQISIQPVVSENISKVRNLNSVLFPVRYSKTFYENLLQPNYFGRLAYFNAQCVGTITCCKQPLGYADVKMAGMREPSERCEMYMMTLGVLAPFRRMGIAQSLVKCALETAAEDPSIKRVVLHVQVGNDDALGFYHKLGFVTTHTVDQYYKHIEPSQAYDNSDKTAQQTEAATTKQTLPPPLEEDDEFEEFEKENWDESEEDKEDLALWDKDWDDDDWEDDFSKQLRVELDKLSQPQPMSVSN
ncbi:hypothetical protein IWW36_003068 [Coemansia brasiliensis]|uniref:26S proteasome complex subunit SEM1 n=1 Tax=Coemansia brasiliensis TaxID=2650707 RepID=A0A9W8ICB1_9FUNG|nr:hypothetical protein IWW36_003068 [Coemansia brasiliensis]